MNTFGVGEIPTLEQQYNRAKYVLEGQFGAVSGGDQRYWQRMVLQNTFALADMFEYKYMLERHNLYEAINESNVATSGLRLATTHVIRCANPHSISHKEPYEVENVEQVLQIIYGGLEAAIISEDPDSPSGDVDYFCDIFVVGLDIKRALNKEPGPTTCFIPMEGLVVLNRVLAE